MQITRKSRFVHQKYAREAGRMKSYLGDYFKDLKNEDKIKEVNDFIRQLKLVLYKIRFSSRMERINKKIQKRLRRTLKGKLNE